MSDFKSEYRQAVDRLEPDGRLIENLKADMKAALDAPPRPNFFIRHRWAFASAAACLVMAFAVGIFLSLGRLGSESMMAGDADSKGESGGMDIDMAENVPGFAEPGGEDADGFYNGNYGTASTTTSTFKEETGSAGSYEPGSPVLTDNDNNNISADSNGEEADIFAILLSANSRGIEERKPLSYEELKKLVAIHQQIGLTMSDIDFYTYDAITEYGYDYIQGANEVYLLMRYENNGVSYPVIAAFEGALSLPSAELTSLRLYFGYAEPYHFIELSLMSEEALDNYFLLNDKRPFSISDMPFDDIELRGFEPVTFTRLKEWAVLAERGELTYGELERCAHTTKLYKGLYAMGCIYRDEKTGESYVLISCYFVQSSQAVPAYVVLRDLSSGDTLDLLHEYYMLDRFLSE